MRFWVACNFGGKRHDWTASVSALMYSTQVDGALRTRETNDEYALLDHDVPREDPIRLQDFVALMARRRGSYHS